MKPLCIYIASRLSADNPIQYLYNLKQSLKAAAEVWRKGHYPYVPGLDFMLYLELDGRYGRGGCLPYRLGLEWLRRCDAILIVNGLEDSEGVKREYREALRNGKRVFFHVDAIPEVDEFEDDQ